MSLFRATSSNTSITSDVQSNYIPPSSIRTKWARDRQYFCLWIPWTTNTRILTRSTRNHRVLHNMQKAWKEQQNTESWVDINFALKKGLKFSQTRSNAIFLHETLPAFLYPEMFGWKLEKSFTIRHLCHLDHHRGFPWDMIGWRIWVQKLLDKQKSTNQLNQILIQIMIVRRDSLWQNKRPVRVLRKSIHVSLVTAGIPICLFERFEIGKRHRQT